MQMLLDKHATLASYSYNYAAILEHYCIGLTPSFLQQLVANRAELKDSVYPPLSEEEKQLVPILREFLHPP